MIKCKFVFNDACEVEFTRYEKSINELIEKFYEREPDMMKAKSISMELIAKPPIKTLR